jgi:hypothetical protein
VKFEAEKYVAAQVIESGQVARSAESQPGSRPLVSGSSTPEGSRRITLRAKKYTCSVPTIPSSERQRRFRDAGGPRGESLPDDHLA